MRGIAILASGLAAACLARAPAASPVASTLSREDSTAVVRAAWEAATGEHPTLGRAVWLWVPAASDTARAVPLSPAVRDALVRRGLSASERRPAGDDTVVYRLTGWRADSAGVVIGFESGWTTVSGLGGGRCRSSVGNAEEFRVRRRDGRWTAERAGPVLHGDGMCRPIP